MTIDERIGRVRRLDKEATPGPWNEHHMCGTCAGKGTYWPRCYQCDDSTDDHICPGEQECPSKRGPDSLLIAAYREDAPALADEVERLRGEVEQASDLAMGAIEIGKSMAEALRAALPYLEQAAEEQPMYGNFPGGDPRHFTPDPEASTEEERAAWRAACEAAEMQPSACEWVRRGDLPEGVAKALERVAEKRGDAPGDPDDIVRVTRAMFGLGSYVVRNEEAAALLERVRALLGEQP